MAKNNDITKRSSNEDVIVTGKPVNTGDDFSPDQNALESIVTQWSGGERVLAGARASELVYGKGKKPNQKTLDELMERAPGIEKYISAPNSGVVVDTIPDESGVPNSRLPEANQTQAGQNQSSDAAKAEQNEVDQALEAGRKAREDATHDDKNILGSTELNPGNDLSNKPNDPDRPNRNPNKR